MSICELQYAGRDGIQHEPGTYPVAHCDSHARWGTICNMYTLTWCHLICAGCLQDLAILAESNDSLQQRARQVLDLRNKGRPAVAVGLSQLDGADTRYRWGGGAHCAACTAVAQLGPMGPWPGARMHRMRSTIPAAHMEHA